MQVAVVFLAVVCIAAAVEKRSQKCYGNLGCFQTFGSFYTLPHDPSSIKTSFMLFSRHDKVNGNTYAATDENSWKAIPGSTNFKSSRPTKFIIHGLNNSGFSGWVRSMRLALLARGDYNVIVVDWGHGSQLPYTQATANTFLVSAQVTRFIKFLHTSGHVDLKSIHLIGHSLGAHLAGNIGSAIPGLARISGLDPAEPYFRDFSDNRRLTKTDAVFVDVIHTDGETFVGIKGFGLLKASGDIDFYPNGGVDQPGCTDSPIGGVLGSIFSGHGHVMHSFSCSHDRSHDYYMETIKGGSSCLFTGHSCADWSTYEKGACHGCPAGGCPIMGFDADKSSARGSFYLSTVQKAPFCGHEYFIEIDIASIKENAYGRLFVTLTGTRGTSPEVEFSRDERHYHQSDSEKHMVAIRASIGSVTAVKVRFHGGSGLSSLGTDVKEVDVNRVLIRDATSSHQVKFCAHNAHILDDKSIRLTSHTGC